MTKNEMTKTPSTRVHGRLLKRYGPWAVVTGASDGIGRAFAVQLAEAGFNLVLAARRREVLTKLAHELEQRHAISTSVATVDLSTHAGVEALIASTSELRVGLLVAAAGFGTSGPFLESPLDDELAMIDLNCRAVVTLSHGMGQRFARQRHGGIVLMSSLLAFQGVPRAAHYAATKAFVQTFAEGLHHELQPFGVDVIASAPGPIHSGFAARAQMTMSAALLPSVVAQQTLHALGRKETVRPGWLSKLLEYSLRAMPRQGRVRMMQVVMGGMTKHRL